MPQLLLVEDDAILGTALSEYLRLKDFTVYWARDARKGRQLFTLHPIDVCLLDVGLPGDTDGFDLARELRRQSRSIPLLFLAARALKADKLRGFALGADDYLVKPVDEEELVARLHAILRRGQTASVTETHPVYRISTYRFDTANQQLQHATGQRQLTSREAYLLELLCERQNKLLPREQVLKSVWQQNDYFTRRSMDVFISRLRKYLAEDPSISIENVYGSGFILKVDENDAN